MTHARAGSAATPHDDLDRFVRTRLAEATAVSAGPPADVPADWLQLFDAMAGSRLLDIAARRLRERGLGFYTIGSAGHESNAFVAAAVRPTDPALLHYRSGAFFLARAQQAGRSLDDALRAVLLGMVAAVADPASGGRHKVFGDASLAVIPQTSTIASHLPRAVGVAFAIGRARRLGVDTRWPADALAICSFGDASINHSTAVGALNTAGYCVSEGLPLPLLLVCEDNGLGISVSSPPGWVAQTARRPGIGYLAVDGEDPRAVEQAAREAAQTVRRRRRPVLLHLRTVRFLGHAGTDVESGYRTPAAIAADRERDPLLGMARALPGVDLAARYDAIARRVEELAEEVCEAAPLTTAEAVIAPLAPRDDASIAVAAHALAAPEARAVIFAGRLPEAAGPLTLAQCINATLSDQLAARPRMCVFGEDVGRKGGVYGLTRGLQQVRLATSVRHAARRAVDLGLGAGLGVSGLLPVPEIQYLAYLHNAEDQLRGEAASLRFFSGGTFANPMVVRVAGLAYQKGFGGHFHNDNAVAVLRDIPGLVVAVPGPSGGRRADAAELASRRRRRGTGERLPRADRALSRARPARAGRRRLAGRVLPRWATSRSGRRACTATAAISPSSPSATACG